MNICAEIIKVVADIGIVITAIVSVFLSIRAIRKSDWNSAMSTSPSIILRPKTIDVFHWSNSSSAGSVFHEGEEINKNRHNGRIEFRINFSCFNGGRGAAFNIGHCVVKGASLAEPRHRRIPLYQSIHDDPFEIQLSVTKTFNEWKRVADKKINISLYLESTNDQNNVFCKSSWTAKIKPFSKVSENILKVEEIRLFQRKGKVEYSPKPFA